MKDEKSSKRLAVGEKVHLSEIGSSEYRVRFVGMAGTVVEDDRSSVPFCVRFDNGDRWWFCAKNIERVAAKKPINYQRLALSMSKAKTIKQAREIYTKGIKVPAKKGK